MELRKSLGNIQISTKGLVYLSFAIIFIIVTCKASKTRVLNWTKVTELWPIGEKEFFVATAQGHHFIDVNILNLNLVEDIDVELQYYYRNKATRPSIEMVLKGRRIEVLEHDKPGEWLTHWTSVKRSDCVDNRIRYNVLLHQNDDVFAWRLIKISSSRPATATTEKVETGTVITQLSVTTETSTIQNPTTTSPRLETTTPERSTRETTTKPPGFTDGAYYQEEQLTTKAPESTTKEPEPTTKANPTSSNTETTTFITESTLWNREPTSQNKNTENDSPDPSNNEASRDRDKKNDVFYSRRSKRWADSQDQSSNSWFCKPSSCDKSIIVHPRFMVIQRGLPEISKEDLKVKEFYLNTQGKALNIMTELDKDITKANPCIDLEFFMDRGTEMELSIQDTNANLESKTLELIQPRPKNAGAKEWERLRRCTSDYMPHLRNSNLVGKELNFTIQPRSRGSERIAILVDPKELVKIGENTPPLEYVPNINGYSSGSPLTKFWSLDSSGAVGPNCEVESTSQSGAAARTLLRISNINPQQESFDITSKWIKIKNLETLENPVFFFYRADQADWVKSVNFEYQSASNPPGSWLSWSVLSSSTPALITTLAPEITPASGVTSTLPTTTQQTIGENLSTDTVTSTPTPTPTPTPTDQNTQNVINAATLDETSTSINDMATTNAVSVPEISSRGHMLIPVRLKGLNSEEFRLRVRHNLTDEAQLSTTGLNLAIRTLAFGDACAESSFCLNGGICRSKGIGIADCVCEAGYSGEHCEIVKPCEVKYDGKTGYELCKSVASKCITDIPVFRCLWPDDKYFQCKPLYTSQEGNLIPLPPDPNPPQVLQQRIDEQQRMIIIMIVFMGALLLFSIVIIGNMISKLMKSKRRLKKAESDVHELTRRSVPSTSASSLGRFGQTGRNKAAAVVSYNNQAFDAA